MTKVLDWKTQLEWKEATVLPQEGSKEPYPSPSTKAKGGPSPAFSPSSGASSTGRLGAEPAWQLQAAL